MSSMSVEVPSWCRRGAVVVLSWCCRGQIMRVSARDEAAWAACERVSLISSALATVFLGKFAPIDHSDGSGINLLNISTREWYVGSGAHGKGGREGADVVLLSLLSFLCLVVVAAVAVVVAAVAVFAGAAAAVAVADVVVWSLVPFYVRLALACAPAWVALPRHGKLLETAASGLSTRLSSPAPSRTVLGRFDAALSLSLSPPPSCRLCWETP